MAIERRSLGYIIKLVALIEIELPTEISPNEAEYIAPAFRLSKYL